MWSQLQSVKSDYFNCLEGLTVTNLSHIYCIPHLWCWQLHSGIMRKKCHVSKMCLPWKRPTAKLLYEDLTAVLNSFDICALPRVMFAPVLLLFHWRTENTLTISTTLQKMMSEMITSARQIFCHQQSIKLPLMGVLLTCGFAVGLLAVWTVIYVNIWSVIFIHPNTAETTHGTLFNVYGMWACSKACRRLWRLYNVFFFGFFLFRCCVTVNLSERDLKLGWVS